jgi:hypothetical protein
MNFGLEQISALTTAWSSLLFITASVFGCLCALGAAWAELRSHSYSRPPLVRGFLRLFLECARQLARKGFHRQARRHHGGGGWLRETSKWDYEIMRALLLRAPSFGGFEGGAGSRWEFASLAFGATE